MIYECLCLFTDKFKLDTDKRRYTTIQMTLKTNVSYWLWPLDPFILDMLDIHAGNKGNFVADTKYAQAYLHRLQGERRRTRGSGKRRRKRTRSGERRRDIWYEEEERKKKKEWGNEDLNESLSLKYDQIYVLKFILLIFIYLFMIFNELKENILNINKMQA